VITHWDELTNLTVHTIFSGGASDARLLVQVTLCDASDARLLLVQVSLLNFFAVLSPQAGRPGFNFRQVQGSFSLCHRVQTGSGAHSDFYPIGTGGCSSPTGKLAKV
jgi:hypothetical protein